MYSMCTPLSARPRRRALLGAALAGAVLVSGCSRIGGDDASRAPLSSVCGSTNGPPVIHQVPVKPDKGERYTDDQAHLSFMAIGEDHWRPWTQAVSPGHLGALFAGGFYMVTEAATPSGEYDATVLSGRVYPGDQQYPDLQCVAQQLGDDLRGSKYPSPNERTDLIDKAVTVGDRPGHLLRFRLNYDVAGYASHSEVVTVEVVDTGRADLSVLYASIPDIVKEYNKMVDQVVASLQPD